MQEKNANYRKKNEIDPNSVLDNIKSAYNIRTDQQLSARLDISFRTISDWRLNNRIDVRRILEKAQDLNAGYILYGEKPVYKRDMVAESKPEYVASATKEIVEANKKLVENNEKLVNSIADLTQANKTLLKLLEAK